MPTAGSDTFDGTGELAYDDSSGCTVFTVHCKTGSSVEAMVHIDGLHESGDFFTVEKGQTIDFRMAGFGIKKVFIKGNAGVCTVNFGATAKIMSAFGQVPEDGEE
jgi:hypothetical protein